MWGKACLFLFVFKVPNLLPSEQYVNGSSIFLQMIFIFRYFFMNFLSKGARGIYIQKIERLYTETHSPA
jgi:hypothetical protein